MKKQDHEAAISRHLFHNPGQTRTELSEQLDVRKNTIGAICDRLIEAGIMREDPPNTRRNARLFLAETAFLTLGVEHRTDCLRTVLLNTKREIVFKSTDALPDMSQEKRMKRIASTLGKALGEASIPRERIVGMGFSDFVPHNIGTGLKIKSVWMPEWGDLNIKAALERELGLPLTAMRCTDAYSIAEHHFGSCQNENAFCVVQLDQGIGLSVFRNGMFLTGSTDIFGELGHTVYQEDGEICKCGNRGCLETFAGTASILEKVTENISRGLYFRMPSDPSKVTFDDIVMNAREGNKLARLVLTEATKAVGDTISTLVNILGITRIQLYGELAKAGELLLHQVMGSVSRHCIYPLNQNTEVRISELDGYASALGAAYLVMERYFDGEKLRN
jgi:predicted NBD/HSP70 family sugar kinase